jgi:hypothetical protein
MQLAIFGLEGWRAARVPESCVGLPGFAHGRPHQHAALAIIRCNAMSPKSTLDKLF